MKNSPGHICDRGAELVKTNFKKMKSSRAHGARCAVKECKKKAVTFQPFFHGALYVLQSMTCRCK